MDLFYFKKLKMVQVYFDEPINEDLLVYCSLFDNKSPCLISQLPKHARFASFSIPNITTFQLIFCTRSTGTPFVNKTFCAVHDTGPVASTVFSVDWSNQYPSISRHSAKINTVDGSGDFSIEGLDIDTRELIISRSCQDDQLPSQVVIRDTSTCTIHAYFKMLPNSLLSIRLSTSDCGYVPPKLGMIRYAAITSKQTFPPKIVKLSSGIAEIEDKINIGDKIAIVAPPNITLMKYCDERGQLLPIDENVVVCQYGRLKGLEEDPSKWPDAKKKIDDLALDEPSGLQPSLSNSLAAEGITITGPVADLCNRMPHLVEYLVSIGEAGVLKDPEALDLFMETPGPVLRAFLYLLRGSPENGRMIPSLKQYLDMPELMECFLNFPDMPSALRGYDLSRIVGPITPVATIMGFKDEPVEVKNWLCRQPPEELGLWLKLVARGTPIECLVKLRMESKIQISEEDPVEVYHAFSFIESKQIKELKDRFLPNSELFAQAVVVVEKLEKIGTDGVTGFDIIEIKQDIDRLIGNVIREIDSVSGNRPSEPEWGWARLKSIASNRLDKDPIKGLTLIENFENEYNISLDGDALSLVSDNNHTPQLKIDGLLLVNFAVMREERRKERKCEIAQTINWLGRLCDVTPIPEWEACTCPDNLAKLLSDTENKIDIFIANHSHLRPQIITEVFPDFSLSKVGDMLSVQLDKCMAVTEQSPDIDESTGVTRIIKKIHSNVDIFLVNSSADNITEMVDNTLKEISEDDQPASDDRAEIIALCDVVKNFNGNLRLNLQHVMSGISKLKELVTLSVERTIPWQSLTASCEGTLLARLECDRDSSVDELRDAVTEKAEVIQAEVLSEWSALVAEAEDFCRLHRDIIDPGVNNAVKQATHKPEMVTSGEGRKVATVVYEKEYDRLSNLSVLAHSTANLRTVVMAAKNQVKEHMDEIRASVNKYTVADEPYFQQHLTWLYERNDLVGIESLYNRVAIIESIWSQRRTLFKTDTSSNFIRLLWVATTDDLQEVKDLLIAAAVKSRIENIMCYSQEQLVEVLDFLKSLPGSVKDRCGRDIHEIRVDLRDLLKERFSRFLSDLIAHESILNSELPKNPDDPGAIITWLFDCLKNRGFESQQMGWPVRPENMDVRDPLIEMLCKYNLVPR